MATITTAEFTEIKRKVCEHEVWIDGNGKEGAKTRLKRVEDSTDRIERKLDKMSNALWGLVATIAGGVILWVFTSVLPTLLAK
jgi:hypothetical protein